MHVQARVLLYEWLWNTSLSANCMLATIWAVNDPICPFVCLLSKFQFAAKLITCLIRWFTYMCNQGGRQLASW